MADRILIRTPNHLGDCVMALPMISEIREAYHGTHITLLTPIWLSSLFIHNPGVDDLIPIPSEHVHGLLAVMKIKELIQDRGYDIGYILPPSFGAAAAFKLAGIKNRIGYIADGRRLLLSKPLALPEPLNSEHRSRLYFNLLLRGSGAEIEYVNPKIFLNDQDINAAVRILDEFGIKKDQDYAVIAFRAVAESRRWGRENYTALTKQIVAEFGAKVILVGTEDDRKEGDEIVANASAGEVINLAGKSSIRESAAIMSMARFFVGNDSGAAHLAAAVGAPLIVLSGADDPKSTSPISSRKQIVMLESLDCLACIKNRCPLKGEAQMQCMKGISVDIVLTAIRSLYSES